MTHKTISRRHFLAASAATLILSACNPQNPISNSSTPTMAGAKPPPTATGSDKIVPGATSSPASHPTATGTSVPKSVTVNPPVASPAETHSIGSSGMPRRQLGKTDWQLSIIGFGGIVVRDETIEAASALVKKAIEKGINYFDVAPLYGNAEDRLGPALEPYRKNVFLACKTTQRTRDAAQIELNRSLEKARTDHFDLYQFHSITNKSEVDTILGPGGALEAVLAARDAGKIRYIGFSAHNEEAALAMLGRFRFDTILYPINWVTWHAGNFGPRVLQLAQQQGLGILALKSLARQSWPAGAQRSKWPKCWYEPVETVEDALLGMRFTLTKPVTAAVSPGHAELLWLMCDAAPKLKPLTPAEDLQLAEQSKKYSPLFTA